jgi:putative transposase
MQFVLVELKESHPWLRNYHSKMLQMVVRQIDAARSALNTLRTHGRRTGKLKYLEECNTFVYNQSGFKIERHGVTDLLWLSKVGYMEIRLDRKPQNIKQVSVTKKNDRWYANIVCGASRQVIVPSIDIRNKSVGIDVGITKFCHDSDDHEVENPLFYNKTLKRLRRVDRGLSRKQFGSQNYVKHRNMRARLWERIYSKRHDFLHKLSTEYSRRYDCIFVERLKISNMVRNRHLARQIVDSGWGYFKEMLKYKAKLVIEVNPAYTSIKCSRCRKLVPKSLAMRIHRCDVCGAVLDRDYNAAINVKRDGLAMLCLLPVERREVTSVEIQRESMKQKEAIGQVR